MPARWAHGSWHRRAGRACRQGHSRYQRAQSQQASGERIPARGPGTTAPRRGRAWQSRGEESVPGHGAVAAAQRDSATRSQLCPAPCARSPHVGRLAEAMLLAVKQHQGRGDAAVLAGRGAGQRVCAWCRQGLGTAPHDPAAAGQRRWLRCIAGRPGARCRPGSGNLGRELIREGTEKERRRLTLSAANIFSAWLGGTTSSCRPCRAGGQGARRARRAAPEEGRLGG